MDAIRSGRFYRTRSVGGGPAEVIRVTKPGDVIGYYFYRCLKGGAIADAPFPRGRSVCAGLLVPATALAEDLGPCSGVWNR